MSKLTVVARVVASKDCVEKVKAELIKLIAPTRREEGCSEYRLHQDNEEPALFIFYETWDSPSCLQQHMNSDHFKQYLAAVDGMIAEKVICKMTTVA